MRVNKTVRLVTVGVLALALVTLTCAFDVADTGTAKPQPAAATTAPSDQPRRPSRSSSSSSSRTVNRAKDKGRVASSESMNSDGFTLAIEHKMGDQERFSPRAKVSVGRGTFPRKDGARSQPTLTLEQAALSSADQKALQSAVDRDGWYTIRVPASPQQPRGPFVTASIRACSLLASDMRDYLTFNMDKVGNVLSIYYRVPVQSCHGAPAKNAVAAGAKFQTTVSSQFATVGRKPIVETVNPATAGKGEEPGFFRKYWYLIVPAVLIITMAGGGADGK